MTDRTMVVRKERKQAARTVDGFPLQAQPFHSVHILFQIKDKSKSKSKGSGLGLEATAVLYEFIFIYSMHLFL